MPKPHDDVIVSVSEFWRVLAFVLIGFGVALALSWSIDAMVSQRAASVAATTAQA